MTTPEPIPPTPPAPSAPVSLTPGYQTPGTVTPPGRRPYSLGEILSWILVLLVVAATVTFVTLSDANNKGLPGGNDQLGLSAKAAVGLHSLVPGASDQLTQQLDTLAKSPQDRFRLGLVTGEFAGKAEALRRIDDAVQASQELAVDGAVAHDVFDGNEVPEEQLSAFREKWAWFADVALSFEKPAGDPTRARMLSAAYSAAAGVVGIELAALLGGLAGLVLLVIAIVLVAMKRIRPAFAAASGGRPIPGYTPLPVPADRRAYVEGFAWFVGLYFGTSILLQHVTPVPEMLREQISLAMLPFSFTVAMLWPLLRRNTWRQWRTAVGLHAGRGFFREAALGIVGYITGLPVLIVGFLITLLLITLSGASPTHPANQAVAEGNWIVIVFVFLLACVWAPVSEELVFRGLLYSHLRERFGWLISATLVGALFAMVHPQGWTVYPTLAAIGFVLASIREWRGSILPSMVAHAMHNFVVLSFALLMLH